VLTVKNVHVSYDGSLGLRGVDLAVSASELVAVIGPNGAGKTTLLRTISGLVRRTTGTVHFEGADLATLEPDEIVRRGLIHVPEGRMVLGRMSVRDNLLLGAYARPKGDDLADDLDYVLGLFPVLKSRFTQLAGTLSGGEQQMLAIARGLMGKPKLLMLDEPSLGIAPIVVEKIFETMSEIRNKGIAVLLVEQNAVKALAAANHAYVIDLGSVTASGKASDLIQDERVRKAYLGV